MEIGILQQEIDVEQRNNRIDKQHIADDFFRNRIVHDLPKRKKVKAKGKYGKRVGNDEVPLPACGHVIRNVFRDHVQEQEERKKPQVKVSLGLKE